MAKEVIARAKQNLVYIVVFATCFTVLGQLLPSLYYRYFDKRDYYSVKEVVIADKVWRTCQDMQFTVIRHSEILAVVQRVTQFVIVRVDGSEQKVSEFATSGAIEPGDSTIGVNITIPCTLESGNYYLYLVTKYTVNDIEKTYSTKSPIFRVERTEDVQINSTVTK